MPEIDHEQHTERRNHVLVEGVELGALLGGILARSDWNQSAKLASGRSESNDYLPKLTTDTQGDDKVENAELKFDFAGRRHDVIVSITLPDGGKVSRVTEELPGRDKGIYVLKGYQLPNGTLVEKNIHRNTDGSISVLDKDVNNRNPENRHEQRMTPQQFIDWVKEQQRQ